VNYNTIIIHYGEIGLKGKNQPDFRNELKSNIRFRLRSLGFEWAVRYAHSYFYVDVPENSADQLATAVEALLHLPGIAWLARGLNLSRDEFFSGQDINYDIIEQPLLLAVKEKYQDDLAFAVRANRADKRLPNKSMDYERRFGSLIIQETHWSDVNLDNPDVTFHIDMYPDDIFLYTEKLTGAGGLPVGITGRVLTLLSGGIDSPVAAYLAAKRGCAVDFIHFTANRFQQENAADYKVSRIVQDLSKITLRSKLYLVPYTHFEFAALGHKMDYELIIFRRFMARVAESLSSTLEAQALITGDNLAQVASQTLENLVSTTKGISIPVLRPLIMFDKQEIIDLAKKINTCSQMVSADRI
jgi:thiamine biosynthesis protein ThiI